VSRRREVDLGVVQFRPRLQASSWIDAVFLTNRWPLCSGDFDRKHIKGARIPGWR
jgi:hypothetical protein